MKAISILLQLLLLLLWTAGCAVVGSTGSDSFAKKDFDFNIPSNPGTAETLPHGLALIDHKLMHEVMQEEIDRTPIGSYVNLTVLSQSIQGTLLRKEPKKIVLVNSMSTEVVVDSDGRKCAKKSHTPFQIVESSRLERFSILAPPSEKFAPKGMRYHADDLTFEAFEFHSGRMQRWLEPTTNSIISREQCSAVEMERKLAEIPLGSQVALLDESGQKYNAILSHLGRGELTLLNGLMQESIPGPDGNSQIRTSCIPWQSIPIQSISRCAIANSAPSDLASPNDDDKCDLCMSDVIYKSGRRQSDWMSAQNQREVIRILTGRPKRPVFPSFLFGGQTADLSLNDCSRP